MIVVVALDRAAVALLAAAAVLTAEEASVDACSRARGSAGFSKPSGRGAAALEALADRPEPSGAAARCVRARRLRRVRPRARLGRWPALVCEPTPTGWVRARVRSSASASASRSPRRCRGRWPCRTPRAWRSRSRASARPLTVVAYPFAACFALPWRSA